MVPYSPTSSGLRPTFSENSNHGTSPEQIFRRGDCDGPGKRKPWNGWGRFSFSGILEPGTCGTNVSTGTGRWPCRMECQWFGYNRYRYHDWKRTQSSSSLLHILPSIKREMAPFGPVVARIRALQDPINQLQYNRRECQQLVDHIKTFIASLKEKDYVQNLLDLQRKLSE